jgi:hypothetical protein
VKAFTIRRSPARRAVPLTTTTFPTSFHPNRLRLSGIPVDPVTGGHYNSYAATLQAVFPAPPRS